MYSGAVAALKSTPHELPDVAVYIAENERRTGFGRGIHAALLPFLARQGFYAAHVGIALPNSGSVGAHKRLRFRHFGTVSQVGCKLGQCHEVAVSVIREIRRTGQSQFKRLVSSNANGWSSALQFQKLFKQGGVATRYRPATDRRRYEACWSIRH